MRRLLVTGFGDACSGVHRNFRELWREKGRESGRCNLILAEPYPTRLGISVLFNVKLYLIACTVYHIIYLFLRVI